LFFDNAPADFRPAHTTEPDERLPSLKDHIELLDWLEAGIDGDAISKAAVKEMIDRISKIENIFGLKN
jgi:hypothetical protein